MHEEIPAVRRAIARRIPLAALLAAPALAHASFLSGDALDTFANWLSWFVILVIPLAAIAVFLFVHVLPEKIAEKREHPHKDSIKVLCILSLFFGGMLWPFAWLWAYTKPIGYRAIYGTEKHEDYYIHMADKARAGQLDREELEHLLEELHAMEERHVLSLELKRVLADVEALLAAPATPTPRAARVAETVAAGDE